MRKKSLFTVAMMISMAGAAHAAGAEALPIPPGLEVGQIPLRFQEPVKADAPEKIVADVWRRSKEIRSQNLAAYLKQQPEKVAAGPWRRPASLSRTSTSVRTSILMDVPASSRTRTFWRRPPRHTTSTWAVLTSSATTRTTSNWRGVPAPAACMSLPGTAPSTAAN
jgi:hypothetical protein